MNRAAIAWVTGGDTGVSSKAIWAVMMGVDPDPMWGWNYPHDPDDLGRCLRLLACVPEWRLRIDEMAAVSPPWAALVEHWDELEALWREEGDGSLSPPIGTRMNRLYERMQHLTDNARKKSGEAA